MESRMVVQQAQYIGTHCYTLSPSFSLAEMEFSYQCKAIDDHCAYHGLK